MFLSVKSQYISVIKSLQRLQISKSMRSSWVCYGFSTVMGRDATPGLLFLCPWATGPWSERPVLPLWLADVETWTSRTVGTWLERPWVGKTCASQTSSWSSKWLFLRGEWRKGITTMSVALSGVSDLTRELQSRAVISSSPSSISCGDGGGELPIVAVRLSNSVCGEVKSFGGPAGILLTTRVCCEVNVLWRAGRHLTHNSGLWWSECPLEGRPASYSQPGLFW